MNPSSPIYIVSKGRWESRLTSKALHRYGCPHYIVVEEEEYASYESSVDSSATLLILDKSYQRDYDTCDRLGDSKSKGPGAARNFAWDHAVASGADWHWVMDDNIRGFRRLHNSLRVAVSDATIFKCMEDFCQRYDNVAMGGPNYTGFAKGIRPPFVKNTRIYSCNLIRNDTPYRWRGRYNEDTDLSLRMLKDKWCTISFNAFLQDKQLTQTMKGGNTDAFYAKEGTYNKSIMQVKLHPDVSRLAWKFNRWHHHVDYRPFKETALRLREGLAFDDYDNYGMVYQKKIDGEWVEGPVER